jgi:hypothetical protein
MYTALSIPLKSAGRGTTSSSVGGPGVEGGGGGSNDGGFGSGGHISTIGSTEGTGGGGGGGISIGIDGNPAGISGSEVCEDDKGAFTTSSKPLLSMVDREVG